MTLTLTIRNPAAGTPPPLVIERRDVAIGRASGLDWTLPDPQVSSRHCEIGFRDGSYLLRDTSTNGTLVNGTKLAGLHRLSDHDVIGIGGFEVVVGTGLAAPLGPDRTRDGGQRSPAAPPRASAATPTAAPSSTPIAPQGTSAGSIETALVAALATLVDTRKRQLGELGATMPDALARNPLAGDAAGAATRLAALPAAEAVRAIGDAAAAIERHHAASLRAMQSALRAALAELDPTRVEAATSAAAPGEAREAALWRTYRQRFDGEKLAGKGFVETFARAFREAYETLA